MNRRRQLEKHMRLAVITHEFGPPEQRVRVGTAAARQQRQQQRAALLPPLARAAEAPPPHTTHRAVRPVPRTQSGPAQRVRLGEGKREAERKERRGDTHHLPRRLGLTAETPSMSPSSSSSSMGGSLALAAATAVAFSGSLVIFSLCRAHLSHGAEPEPEPETEEGAAEHALRPCLTSPERRARGGKAKAKARRRRRVRFAADVVDNEGAPRPTRFSPPAAAAAAAASPSSSSSSSTCRDAAGSEARMMPANREALYRGMLRDRSAHRYTCSY